MQPSATTEGSSAQAVASSPPNVPTVVQRIGVPREIFPNEKRVATVPEVVEKLIKLGFTVSVEAGAGDAANFSDDTYRAAGAQIVDGAAALWAESDIVFKVSVPTA
jgi:NAD(P) transhydrogenase subunit alpha